MLPERKLPLPADFRRFDKTKRSWRRIVENETRPARWESMPAVFSQRSVHSSELNPIVLAIPPHMISWSEITRFGDVTITLLAALAIAAWLLAEDEKRLAFWWSLLFTMGLCIVVATKMAFIGWGIGIHAIRFTGFSGHAMRAMAVMPVLFYLMLERTPRPIRALGTLFGLGFGVVIGVSRLAVHAHSLSEVVAGLMLGASVSIGFIWIASATLRKHIFTPLRLSLCLLVLIQAPYVHPAPTQQWLTAFTLYVTGREEPHPGVGWRHGRRPS